MKSNWILGGIATAVGVGVLVAGGVLWAYGHYLGPISNQAGDWGSFGAVLGGAFTLLSAFATIGTFLFLYIQQIKNEERQQALDEDNKTKQIKHDEVVERQLSALTFEQYINHRKLFFERLNEQSSLFNGAIEFRNPEEVYNAIFTKNRPGNCEYFIEIKKPEEAKPYDLTDCIAIYKSIEDLLDNYQNKENRLELICVIDTLNDRLGIKYSGPQQEGDIYFLGYYLGINIYKINKCLAVLESVLNSIIFYSGNEKVDSIQHKGQSPLLRDALYETLTRHRRAKDSFEIRYTIEALPYLHEIYEASQQHFIDTERALDKTYRALAKLFAEQSEILKLKDFDYADSLTDIINLEIESAKIKYKDDKDVLDILEGIDSVHWKAMESLGVTR
jgi:hypothetical protein